ncbi:hypothetical protein HGA34_04030 [Candidatus Falkowbacteria bacterium]|nr:hypothetical protein [Candidatus Falkowbacteria bacterium]
MNTFIRFGLVFLVIALAVFGVLVATKVVNLDADSTEGLLRAFAVLLIMALAGGAIYKLTKGTDQPVK